jgi:hypothetical protein
LVETKSVAPCPDELKLGIVAPIRRSSTNPPKVASQIEGVLNVSERGNQLLNR